jgi:hypothetical protein
MLAYGFLTLEYRREAAATKTPVKKKPVHAFEPAGDPAGATAAARAPRPGALPPLPETFVHAHESLTE